MTSENLHVHGRSRRPLLFVGVIGMTLLAFAVLVLCIAHPRAVRESVRTGVAPLISAFLGDPTAALEGGDTLARALEEAVSVPVGAEPGGDGAGPLYLITFRDCPPCKTWLANDRGLFVRKGVEIRLIPVPGTGSASDRLALSQLIADPTGDGVERWLSMDLGLGAPGIPAAIAAPEASAQADLASVDAFQGQINAAVGASGLEMGYPAFVWLNRKGEWRVAIGDGPLDQARMLEDLKNR